MDKQIDEMARILTACSRNTCVGCGMECIDYRMAKAIYNAGYRKIPENAVVLTREEYEELQKGVKTYNYTAMIDAQSAYRWEQGYLLGRKETADKFVEKAKVQFMGARTYRLHDTGTAWGEPCIGGLINNLIDKIAKEITEGKE